MKKIVYFLIGIFSFVIGLVGVESHVFAKGTFATATCISVNTEYAGTLTESENEKFYCFVLKSSGKVEIEHSNFSESEGLYKLYNNKYDEIASFYGPYDSNRGFAYDIDTYYLMAGKYYLKVYDCTGQYSFDIGFSQANETYNESQSSKYDYIGEAKYVSTNKKIVGQLGLEDSQDIYSFNISNSGTVYVEHTNYFEGNNSYEILDSNGNYLYSFYGPYDSNKGFAYDIDIYHLNKGTYYLKVSEAEGFYNFQIKTDINKKYMITYKLNGGINAKGNPAFYYVTTVTIKLANPARTGYTFKGWYSDSGYKTKVTSIPQGSTGNKTLYAKWSANIYTLRFNGNGAKSGSMASKTSLKYGTSYTLPDNTFQAKSGYTFNGWNTKADGSGKSYANKTSVKNLTSKNGGTVTLYAQWKKVKYTITYKLNGGTNAKGNPSSYYVTTSTIKLANPARTGYTFKGWYSDSKFKTKVTYIAKGSTGNRMLYAKWSSNTYTIKFNGNGAKSGSMASKKSLKYGTSYTLPANAFKAQNGYTFNGWNTKADGSGKSYANKASVKNLTSKNGGTVTLYAQWKKK